MANAWFRLYTDFLDDGKILSLSFQDQRHFIGALALKCQGVLDQDVDPSFLDRIVAQKLWIDPADVHLVKGNLVAAGLIDDDWQPVNWGKRQVGSDADPTNSERQRRYRERKKAPDDGVVPKADAEFDEFWEAYPKKVGKGAAKKSWLKGKPDLQVVLNALQWQVDCEQWRKNGGQFIPNPATYLNQERWLDAKENLEW